MGLRVQNLVKAANSIGDALEEWVGHQAQGTVNIDRLPPGLADIHTEIHLICSRVNRLVKENGASLADPSRRAYKWLSFLQSQSSLNDHARALARARNVGNTFPGSKSFWVGRRVKKIDLRLYNTPALYRSRVQNDTLRISASEGFLFAPETVFQAMIRRSLGSTKPDNSAIVSQFAQSEHYHSIMVDMESSGLALLPSTAGSVYDLSVLYDRLTALSVSRRQAAPILRWSSRESYRTFGKYFPDRDIIEINRSLDRKNVPQEVVEFVLLHELLHREHKIVRKNGRRSIHPRSFKEKEAQLPHASEAQKFLNTYAQKNSRPKKRGKRRR
jgi:predicted SprT family Zn-dependent metalloprotease